MERLLFVLCGGKGRGGAAARGARQGQPKRKRSRRAPMGCRSSSAQNCSSPTGGDQLGKPRKGLQAARDALHLHIVRPEFQIDLGEGIEQQRGDGIAAEEGNAPMVAQQRLCQGRGAAQ